MDYSIELENERTGEIKILSFDTEQERQKLIDALPDDIRWVCFENGSFAFAKKVDWELAIK